ncbi:MAG: hypothetical protein ACLQT6_05850 [Desulfomonilaceae bacterium]
MRLIKRLIELAFVILIISLFMKNKDIELSINYFGLKEPIRLAFWELVTICVSLGIIIAALGDFITQLKWVGERRRMIKTDRGHHDEVKGLSKRISDLESENQRLQNDLEQKNSKIAELEHSSNEIHSNASAGFSSEA